MVAARGGTTQRGWWRMLVGALAALLLACFIGGPGGLPVAFAADPEPSPETVVTDDATEEETPPGSGQQRVENVIAAARQYLGIAYRVGTEGPSLFDCSGLVFRAFSDASLVDRISGNRLRAAGYMRWFARQGLMTANEEEAQRGDLVVYDQGRHIGIYLGDGRTISALLSGVTVHSLHGISQDVTGFLRPDWSGAGEVAPFVPVELPDVVEEPAVLVPPSDWMPFFADDEIAPIERDGIERADLRTASSRTFENPDGTFTTEFHAQPIHYLAPKSGELEPIDLHFGTSDRLRFPTVTRSPVQITARPADDAAGLLGAAAGDWAVSLRLPDGSRSQAAPTIVDDGRVVDYFDLLTEGVGLRVMAAPDGFRSFLVLSREPDANRFTLALDAPGLTAMLDELGDVLLLDEAGTTIARIPRPMLLDSSDTEGLGGGLDSAATSLELTVSEAQTLLTLVVRPRFLAEAAYPAYLDLVLTGFPAAAPAADLAFVSSRHPDAALGGFSRPEAAGAAELLLGRQPRTRHESQALLRFNELRSTLGTVDIAAASLELLPYLQRDAEVAAVVSRLDGEWSADAVTWTTLPAVGAEIGEVLGASGAWLGIDLSDYVTDVLSRGTADGGLLLHGRPEATGTWKRILIGELGPRLVVTWSGLRPTAIAQDQAALGPEQQVAPEEPVQVATTFGWKLPALAGAHDRFALEVSRDGFATVDYATGVVKGKAGRTSEFALPADALSASGEYAWRIRVKLAGGAWSEWSAPQTFSFVGVAPAPVPAATPTAAPTPPAAAVL